MSIDVARQQARAAAERFRAEFPTELQPDASFDVTPLASVVVGDVRPSLLMLLAAVGLIAVLVSANTGNLLLARASARRREFAVRIAVGASRWRLVRQLLTEGIVLSVAGGVGGGVLGLAVVRALVQLELVRIPRIDSLEMGGAVDVRLLALVAAGALAMGLAVGLAPAAATRSHQEVERELRTGSRGGHSRRERTAQRLLLAVEIAVACVVLIGAALLIRSLARLQQVDPGFTTSAVSTLQTASGDRRLASADEAVRVFQAGLQRLTEVPGVATAAVSLTGVPLAQSGALRVDVVGRPVADLYIPNWDSVSPDYFDVFGIRLVRGRLFSERDRRGATPVAVINETMARQLWSGDDPLGQRVLVGQGAGPAFEESEPRDITGIVSDVRQFGLSRPPRPGIYVPLAQMADTQMAFFNRLSVPATWAVRTLSPAAVPPVFLERQVLAATGLPAAHVRTMDDVFDASTAATAQNTWLMSTFGALAMLVAVLGVYSIASQSVERRTHELGVRMALGAEASAVRRLIVRESLRPVLSGTVLGIAAAVGLSGLLTTFLFGVSRHDPLTFAVVPALLVAAAGAGAYLPARRASALDPLVILRE